MPELKGHVPIYSRDGWLFMANRKKTEFFLNPFTRECINLPNNSRFFPSECLAFSAAPTSSSCLVVTFTHQITSKNRFVIATWRPAGETVWTFHRFRNKSSCGKWDKFVYSNGVFYGFSNCGFVGVFDPCNATWKVLPVKPWDCPAFCQIDFSMKNVLMMEHSGNIFAMSRQLNNKSPVFKLNLERMLWEENREVCGLSVFASYPESERNRTYPSANVQLSQYCSLVNEKSSRPPTSTYLSKRVAWVAPPDHNNNVNL
ncbi:unnamed protein product [Eruca vesicaria subsp. sativa]|uniref:KIB1-4 beta-propeller domain-containing protein n=1 Tax=Eruca vesicaria subsp. sativa TaxID=29727 RepID=A0ABC8JPR3_ERUVS|nr:unnamed protein product [Eruca vesicaria subsp. sativa]